MLPISSPTFSQGLSSYRLGRARRDLLSSLAPGSKMREPGNEVVSSLGLNHGAKYTFDTYDTLILFCDKLRSQAFSFHANLGNKKYIISCRY